MTGRSLIGIVANSQLASAWIHAGIHNTANAECLRLDSFGIVTMTYLNLADLHVWTVSMLLVNMSGLVVLLVEMSILPVIIY